MVIIPELNEALSYHLYYYRNSLALCKFILYGQMDIKIINIKYLSLENLRMLKANALIIN